MQLTFFSAEAAEPAIRDLAGLLVAHGQAAIFGATAARLSVTVTEPWRARALTTELAERGIEGEIASTETGSTLIRTAFRADLLDLAREFSRGSVKSVPPGYLPDGAALRLWLICAGVAYRGGYLLGLDPRAEHTHEQLLRGAQAVGLAARSAAVAGPRAGGPALRVSGKRRLRRLAELVGPPPAPAPDWRAPDWPAPHWPAPVGGSVGRR